MTADTLKTALLALRARYNDARAEGVKCWWDEATTFAFRSALAGPGRAYTDAQVNEAIDATLRYSVNSRTAPTAPQLSSHLQRIKERDDSENRRSMPHSRGEIVRITPAGYKRHRIFGLVPDIDTIPPEERLVRTRTALLDGLLDEDGNPKSEWAAKQVARLKKEISQHGRADDRT